MTASARTLVMVVALAAAAVATVAAPRPVAAQEDEEEVLVGEARRAIARRDYGRAGTLLDQALAANPRRLDVYVLRATVHGVRGEHAEAVALMRRAQKLAPDSDDVLATLGIQLVLADQADEGVPLLEALVAHAPGRYDAQVVLGHYYVRRGRWDDAVTAFAAYFDHRPASAAGEDALHRVDQANAHLRSGDPRRALALYRQVLAAAPDNVLARLGVAWSMAAIDCRQALAIFDDLADLEARYAEVSLVRGRCAMRMGRLDDALTAAQRYRDARPDAGDGWALIGDVAVAKHKLAAAEKAYTRAAEAEPDDRLYAFKLARIERLRDQPAKAAARLRAAGAPPEYEDDWALELGEALYATAAWDDLAAHIGPWAGAHPERATGQFLLGVAIAGRGDVDGAVAPLELAVAGGEARARPPLIHALGTLATDAVGRGDLATADSLLGRAEAVDDDVLTWRNHGAVLIALGRADDAVAVLERATRADRGDAVAQHLMARALHALQRWDDARAAYRRAIKAYGKDPRAVAARTDLANAELAAGNEEDAVAALVDAVDAAPDAAARATATAALITAARAAATAAMRAGRFATAVKVLRQIEKRVTDAGDVTAVRCDLALAATGAALHDTALDQLARLDKSGARCPFVAPADELAVPILMAWNEGASLRRASKALARLDKLKKSARGVAGPLAKLAGREITLRAAAEAYGDGDLKAAARFLRSAASYDPRSPELAHDLAVLDLATGKTAEAIRKLARLTGDVPEAWLNLGIAYEREGRQPEALTAWRKARAAGVRFGPLDDWITAKERFWGGGQ